MLVLDTDHVVFLQQKSSAPAGRLSQRLSDSEDQVATTVVTLEEQCRGWLAAIHRETRWERQILPYFRFQELFEFFSEMTVLPWTEAAVKVFEQMRINRVRIGTMDLKIACIAISNDALLLTRNTVDFEKVPGLKFEDWLS